MSDSTNLLLRTCADTASLTLQPRRLSTPPRRSDGMSWETARTVLEKLATDNLSQVEQVTVWTTLLTQNDRTRAWYPPTTDPIPTYSNLSMALLTQHANMVSLSVCGRLSCVNLCQSSRKFDFHSHVKCALMAGNQRSCRGGFHSNIIDPTCGLWVACPFVC